MKLFCSKSVFIFKILLLWMIIKVNEVDEKLIFFGVFGGGCVYFE